MGFKYMHSSWFYSSNEISPKFLHTLFIKKEKLRKLLRIYQNFYRRIIETSYLRIIEKRYKWKIIKKIEHRIYKYCILKSNNTKSFSIKRELYN